MSYQKRKDLQHCMVVKVTNIKRKEI